MFSIFYFSFGDFLLFVHSHSSLRILSCRFVGFDIKRRQKFYGIHCRTICTYILPISSSCKLRRYNICFLLFSSIRAPQLAEHQGLGGNAAEEPNENDDEYDAYRKRMMLAYRFRPNPLVSHNLYFSNFHLFFIIVFFTQNNPRRAYY